MSSTNKFEQALKSTMADEISITENGAVGYKTTGAKLLDINFAVSSLRNKSDAEISKMFSEAYYENPLLAVKWMFMLRDVRGSGMGERRSFRICMAWLADVRPDVAVKLVNLIPEFGRWDDLFCLIDADYANHDKHKAVKTDTTATAIKLIDEQWATDVQDMNAGKSISLLAKWMPSCNTSSAKTVALARFFCKELSISEKQYRKTLSAMRKYLNVIEQKMSAKQWSEIDYEAIPSKANIKYNSAFLRNDEDRRRKFLDALEKGEAKINSSANFPSDIVHAYSKNGAGYSYYGSYNVKADAALEAMWKALPNFVKNQETGSTIVVADSSGSMTTSVSGTSMTAMEVAYSLAIYFAEKLTGPFKDKTITFSHSPKYLDMTKAKSLAEKLSIMYKHSEVADTNIEAVFDLILQTAVRHNLDAKDLPANVLIVSDMEFNAAQGNYYSYGHDDKYNASQCALFKTIEKKWTAHGYKLPRLVFWNVASRTGTIPLTQSESGVALVSGYSPAIANMVFSAKLDPYEVLVDALNAERYAPVEAAVKDVL